MTIKFLQISAKVQIPVMVQTSFSMNGQSRYALFNANSKSMADNTRGEASIEQIEGSRGNY